MITSKAFSADATNKTDSKRYQLLLHEIAKLINTNPAILKQQLTQFKVAIPQNATEEELITAVSTTIQHNKAFAAMVWNDILTMEGATPGGASKKSAEGTTLDDVSNYGGINDASFRKVHLHKTPLKKHPHKKDEWKSAAGLSDILTYGGNAIQDMGKIFGGNNQAAANIANSAGASPDANQAAANLKNKNAQQALNDSLTAQKKPSKGNIILYVGGGILAIGIVIVIVKMASHTAAPAAAAAK